MGKNNYHGGYMNSIVRIRGHQNLVSYNRSWSSGYGISYVLPPYSTVSGFVHKILDADKLIDFGVSIQGEYDGIFTEVQRAIKIDQCRSDADKKDRPIIYFPNKRQLSYGLMKYDCISAVDLILHIDFRGNTDIQNDFINKLFDSIPILGRGHDLFRIDEVCTTGVSKEKYRELLHAAWVPSDICKKNKLYGPREFIPFIYTTDNGVRLFKKADVSLIENTQFSKDMFIDDSGEMVFMVYHEDLI